MAKENKKEEKNLALDLAYAESFVNEKEVSGLGAKAVKFNRNLYEKKGAGSEFLGWVKLPLEVEEEQLREIQTAANFLREKVGVLVVIGIGGSYLGARAAIEALSDSFAHTHGKGSNPLVVYAGHNLSEDYLAELREFLKEKDYAITVISKSGTTLEPALAFRVLKKDLEERYGKEEANQRIIAITDQSKGALKKLADKEDYTTFVIPDDTGGRYSVLTPVGLVPIALAGFDITKLLEGAKSMEAITGKDKKFEENPAALYAVYRNLFYQKGRAIEVFENYNPKLHFITEWAKQLFGESEGKEEKGLFPAGVDFTSDLHSLGQYIQEGKNILFETVLSVEENQKEIVVPEDEENLDQLNYLAGKRLGEINQKAQQATTLAHVKGKTPNLIINIPEINEFYLGQLFYFLEKSCAISAYLLGVNPFDQPGVEAYKKKMFELLGKSS